MNALSTVNANTFYFLNNIAVDISYGLTYYYTFDISTNNTNINYLKNLATQVYDLSLVGTLVNLPLSPKYGLSYLYLTNSKVQQINPYNFVQTNGVTISFWTYFNITPITTPILMFLGNILTNLGIGINNSNNLNNLYYYINGTIYSTTNNISITINTWTNITITLDSNNSLKLYVAGVLVDQKNNVYIASGRYPIYLGGGASGSSVSVNYYSGYIDDFRLYNNCLNGRQILNIFKFGGISGYSLPVDPVGLMSYYRFEPTDISLNTVSNFADYLYNSTYNNLTSYTPVYDASFTNNSLVSYKKYNIGYGTLDLSNSNYLQIAYIPPLTNNGVSFSFWMRSNNNMDSGYYPLFNFGNGPLTDNINFGLYNNKIISSVQNGNNNTLKFGLATNPVDTNIVITNGGDNTIITTVSPGYLIGPATDAGMFYASSVMMAGYNILYGTSPAIPRSGYIYPLNITSTTADWIATYSGDTYHQMVKATVTIVNGNAYVYSSEARFYTKSNYPSTYSANPNSSVSVIYAWNNYTNTYSLAITYNNSSGYAIYSINSIFFKNLANLLYSSTYTLSATADRNTVYTGTYSRTNGDVITYSSFNNFWYSNTLYTVAYINGIRISADGSKGAFITANTSSCYFFTKSSNTYSPAIGSNIADFPSTNIISTGYNLNLTGLDMSLDGSRIVVSSQSPTTGGTGGNIYYTDWNSSIKCYNYPFTKITNISSGDYRGVGISPDKNIIVYGINAKNTVYYSLWSSYGNAYSTPYTLSSSVGPPANFKFTIDGSILYYSLNGNTIGSNLYYSIWNGNNFNGFTSVVDSVGANIVSNNSYSTGLDVLSNNTVYVYKNNTGTSGSNVISYSITNNTTLTAGNLYTTPVNDNVWRHYAWTIDPSNQQYNYYVNGAISSNISGNTLTFLTALNMNNTGLVLYYPLHKNAYNYANGFSVNDAYSFFSQFGVNWTNVGTTYSSLINLKWSSISLSETGQYQIATVYQGNVYLSKNYGSTWNIISTGSYSALNGLKWRSSAISGTGQYITIIAYYPYVVTIYNSVNYGTDWTFRNNSIQRGIITSMSYSGQYQTIVGSGGYYSNNYGNTWAASTGVATDIATGICMSSSGQYQYSCGYYSNNSVVQSSDYGVSFENNISLNTTQSAIATSSDGKYILVGGFSATGLSLSTDSGRSWYSLGVSNGLPINVNWVSLSISDSGQYMIATTKSDVNTNSIGYIYYSTNYGSSWSNVASLSNKEWSKVCLSRDGKCITAITGITTNLNDGNNIYGNPGTIYTSRISIENSLSLPVVPKNVNGYSFSFWFNSSSNNQTGIIWSFNNATNLSTNRIFMGLQNGNIQIGTGSTTFTSIIQPNLNIPNHYVWTFSTSGTSNIYLNGNTSFFITATTVPYYQNILNNNALFSDPVGGNVVAGTITEFRYYDRILSSTDITQIYGNVVSRTQNIIGASNTLTSYFTGGIDEFQMYNRVLSSTEVSQLSKMGTYYNLQGVAASPITGLVANNLTGSISYNASYNYVKGYNISFSPSITGSPFTTTLLTTKYTFVNGINYTANVYAVGVYGNSAISANTFVGIGIPTSPIITTAKSSNTTSISITFTQSPGYINFYTANVVSGSSSIANVTIANTVTSANITSLNPNTLYSVTMVAVNPYGNSSPSSSSSSFTLPNPPTISSVYSENTNSITYIFSSIGGASYYNGNINSSGNTTQFTNITSPYTINNLTANTFYTVNLIANNIAGNSTITSNTYYTLPSPPILSNVYSQDINTLNVSGNLILWLDAADSSTITISNNNVIQWNDKSGKGYNFTGTGSTKTGTKTINSKNVIDITATGAYFSNANFPISSNFTVFFVGYNTATTGFHAICDAYTYILFRIESNNNTSMQFMTINSSGGWATASYGLNTNNTFLLGMSSGNGKLYGYINGNNVVNTNNTNFSGNGLYIGISNDISSFPWNGYIAEYIYYNRSLTDPERIQVEGYLAKKWGLSGSLLSIHPFYNIISSKYILYNFSFISNGYYGNITSNNTNIVSLSNIQNNYYILGNLQVNTAYTSNFYSNNPAGNSIITSNTYYTLPNSPTFSSVTSVNNSITYVFSSVGNATSYNGNIYGNISGTVTTNTLSNITSPYTLANLSPNSQYTIYLYGTNPAGNSTITSNTYYTVPNAPTFSSVTSVNNSITYVFSSVGNATSYNGNIYGNISGTVTTNTLSNITSPYTVNNLSPNSQYTIYLYGNNIAGNSAITSNTYYTLPNAPTFTNISANTNSITYTFSSVGGASYYNGNISGNISGILTTNTLSNITSPSTIGNLSPNSQYTIYLYGTNPAGNSRITSNSYYTSLSGNYITNINVAYSVRLVVPTYTGPIFKLRISTSTTQDFYTDKTQSYISTGANNTGTSFASWVGGNTVYVYTLYDQNGSTNHAVNSANNATQPTFVLQSGKYVMNFVASNRPLLTLATAIAPNTLFTHFTNSNNAEGTIFGTNSGDGGQRLGHYSVNSSNNAGTRINGDNNNADWYFNCSGTKLAYNNGSSIATDGTTTTATNYGTTLLTTTTPQWNLLSLSAQTPYASMSLRNIGYDPYTGESRGLNGYMVEMICHNTSKVTADMISYYNDRLI